MTPVVRVQSRHILSILFIFMLVFFSGCTSTISQNHKIPPSTSKDRPTASQFVVIDQNEPAFIVFTGIPKKISKDELERINRQVAGRETLTMLTWGQFLDNVEEYARSVMLRNDYPKIRVIDGLVCLVASESGSGAPWGLTWNGGIALTYNDYQHARRTYEIYTSDPEAYKPVRDQRRDPVHPAGHLPFAGCM